MLTSSLNETDTSEEEDEVVVSDDVVVVLLMVEVVVFPENFPLRRHEPLLGLEGCCSDDVD